MEPKVFTFSFTVVVEEVKQKANTENREAKPVVGANVTSNLPTRLDAATITNVIDSETIEVELNGDKVDVRLLLVNRPEIVHSDMGNELYSIVGKTVYLEYDGPIWDDYGRLLAYVWMGDKTLNQLFLEEGLVHITNAYDPPYKYYDKYLLAQTRAKNARKGIWSLRDMLDIK